jgi:hypothetical protein
MDPFRHLGGELGRLSATQGCRALSAVAPPDAEPNGEPHRVPIGSLTSIRCEAYARVCHRLQVSADGELSLRSWRDALGLKEIRPEYSLRDALSKARDALGAGGLKVDPLIGSLDHPTAAAIARHLEGGDRGAYFYYWEGLGIFDDGGLYVYRGTPAVVGSLYPGGSSRFQSPTLWWDEDRSWFVATPIDATSSYIGASDATIEELVSDPDMEAQIAEIATPIDDWTFVLDQDQTER